jgi:hypothetical protein
MMMIWIHGISEKFRRRRWKKYKKNSNDCSESSYIANR